MPSFKVRETFTDGSTQNTYLNTGTEAEALGICQTLYGGEHEVLETPIDVVVAEADLVPVPYKRVGVTLRNEGTDSVTFLDLLVKSTVSSADVITTLTGKTINGVLANVVSINSIKSHAV